jgi:hypothetical protein
MRLRQRRGNDGGKPKNRALQSSNERSTELNSPYRRFAICEVGKVLSYSGIRAPADCKSALRQIENLRYN